MNDACEVLLALKNSQALLDDLQRSNEDEFALQSRLRKVWPADLVRQALVLWDLRQRARMKFSRADEMWFNSVGLEQATSEPVARHKAARFAECVSSSAWPVFDLCSGIGGDSLALAEVGHLTTVDRDPAQCLRTAWNTEVYHPDILIRTITDDVETLSLPGEALVHVDPDRRNKIGRRSLRVEDGSPGLDWLRKLIGEVRGGAIKLSPAANFGGKFPECEVELVSWRGECKSATIWFGELRRSGPMRATILPERLTLAGDPWQEMSPPDELRSYLYDPDPAVVRAGLVDLLASRLNLSRLDEAEEYLTGETAVDSPWVAAFEVLEQVPNNARQIREAVRRQDWHEVEIKSRHLKINADQVRRKLPLTGAGRGVLIFARVAGKAVAVLARRLVEPASHLPTI